MRSAVLEEHVSGVGEPVGIALPAPAEALASGARPQIHQQSAGGADLVYRCSGHVRAVGELHEHRIVPFQVIDRVNTQPHAIARPGRSDERHVEVVLRHRERVRQRSDAVVGIRQLDAVGGRRIGGLGPRAVKRIHVGGINHDVGRGCRSVRGAGRE